MLGTKEYEQDYIDACRSRIETQVVMFYEVALAARDHGDADVSRLEGALESLEYEYFNNMLIVLDAYFVHRLRVLEGDDGNALNEVRVLARSWRTAARSWPTRRSGSTRPAASWASRSARPSR